MPATCQPTRSQIPDPKSQPGHQLDLKMTDMPSIDYKVVIVMLLLQTCNSFILLERSPAPEISKDGFVVVPYSEENVGFVEITTEPTVDQGQGSRFTVLTDLAKQISRSSEGDHPKGVAPLATLIEKISQEDADTITKEKMFALAKEMEKILEEIVVPA